MLRLFPHEYRRYVAVAAGVVMQICLGGIYAWSVFVPSLRDDYGYRSAQTQLVFGCTTAVVTLSMLAAGRVHDLHGPRRLSLAGGFLVGCGYTIAGLFGDRFAWLWLGICLVNGTGIGCGYISAVATGVRWFPRHKGIISGVMVAGYGGGAILLAHIAQRLAAEGWTALSIFRMVACLYGPIIICAAALLFVPPADPDAADENHVRLRDVLRDRRFWALAVGVGCGTLPGLIVIGNLKPMGLSFGAGSAATLAISLFAVGNVAGRVVWGAWQDYQGARTTSLLSLGLIATSPLGFLVLRGDPRAFLACSLYCGFCYGGSLSLYVAQAAGAYGVRRVGRVYPWAMLAHGAAAVGGPYVGGWSLDLSGSYLPSLLIASASGLAGMIGYALLTRDGGAVSRA